jgi:hypothetical protein
MTSITDSEWAAVRATLPKGVDERWFRGELERIKSDTPSPKKQETIYIDRARLCANMIQALPGMEHISDKDAIAEQLKRQQQEDSSRGKFYGRITAERQPRRFLQYCNLLCLWMQVGGRIAIKTPGKKRGDHRSPLPTGDVIPYFQAAAKAIRGTAPTAHQIKKIARRCRDHFKPASSDLASSMIMSVNATSVQQGTVNIASSSNLKIDQK